METKNLVGFPQKEVGSKYNISTLLFSLHKINTSLPMVIFNYVTSNES